MNVEKVKQELEAKGFVWEDVLGGMYDYYEVFMASPTIQSQIVGILKAMVEDAERNPRDYMRGTRLEVSVDFVEETRKIILDIAQSLGFYH
jgi:hypothetical protein